MIHQQSPTAAFPAAMHQTGAALAQEPNYAAARNEFLRSRLTLALWIALIGNLTFIIFDATTYQPDLLRKLMVIRAAIEAALLGCLAYRASAWGRRYPVALIPGITWSMLFGTSYTDYLIVRWMMTPELSVEILPLFIRSVLVISLVFLGLTVIAPVRWQAHVLAQAGVIALYIALNGYLIRAVADQGMIVFLLIYLFWLCFVCDLAVFLYERLQRKAWDARTKLQHSYNAIEEQNERLRQDLQIAREIQLGLLPERTPWSSQQIAVHSRSMPAYEVGGDLYTYVSLGPTRAAIAIGDISGKGVSAALLMALASSAIEAQARETEQPGQFLAALNGRLEPQLRTSGMFAALLYVVIDLERRTLCAANAGMIAPLLVRNGQTHLIDVGGLPLGMVPEARYPEVTIALEPDDVVLLLSDGIVEARSSDGALWGFDRLAQVVAQSTTRMNPEDVIDEVFGQAVRFMGGAAQHDDMTIVAVEPHFAIPPSTQPSPDSAAAPVAA